MSVFVKRWRVVFLTLGLTTGCGSLESVSSGRVGCAPSEITISDESEGWNTSSWVATCHGKDYYCSAASSRFGTDVDCKARDDER
ncbi:MAG TPA: hypothetical protein VH062_30820 [Polyangiaceae bacterium]|jgi:hypothetical protein|nr:hypothetical protein [Polyangiaceae bacterium]